MSKLELALLVSIGIMVCGSMVPLWTGDPRAAFSPRLFFTVLIVYYAVLGPLVMIGRDATTLLGIDTRPVFWKGWLVSACAYASFLLGYAMFKKTRAVTKVLSHRSSAYLLGIILFGAVAIAMFFWVAVYAGGISYLFPSYREGAVTTAGAESPVASYLVNGVNLTFGATSLLLLSFLQSRSRLTGWTLALVVLISVSFYVKSGFRYRIAWLMVDLAATYYLWYGRRPSLLLWAPLIGLAVAVMGFIGATRNYWEGLDLRKAQGMSVSEVFLNGFSESGTFMIVSQVLDSVPERLPHTYWEPFWIAIAAPIPRAWWPDKPDSTTLRTLADSFGTPGSAEAGLAVPYFGEWYIAFGWLGVIASSLLMGFVARRVWEWYLERTEDALATMIYAVSLGYMYILFSRGLLAMALMNFMFSLFPLLVMYRVVPKMRFLDAAIRVLPKAHRSQR